MAVALGECGKEDDDHEPGAPPDFKEYYAAQGEAWADVCGDTTVGKQVEDASGFEQPLLGFEADEEHELGEGAGGGFEH